MRNLFRVLLVSSALVAVSAPSAYATPQQEIAAVAAGDFTALADLIAGNANITNLSNSTALCAGDKACVTALLAAYAQAGFTPTAAQLNTVAQTARVTFTADELGQYAIGATGPTTTTTTALPGTGADQNSGGSEPAPAPASSTGPTGSAT